MSPNEIWIWLLSGLVPFSIEWQHMSNSEKVLEVYAFFWSLVIHWHADGGFQWILQIPLIRQLHSVVRTVVTALREGNSSGASIQNKQQSDSASEIDCPTHKK